MSDLSQDEISIRKLRPRFKVESRYKVADLTEKINANCAFDDSPVLGKISYGDGTLQLPIEEQHYWSPQLSLSLEETEEGCILRGLYGPRPAVWTMFVFFYAAIGFSILIIGIIGMSFLSLNKPASILWAIPILILLLLLLYLVAFFGKKLGEEQIHVLHNFIEKCIGMKI